MKKLLKNLIKMEDKNMFKETFKAAFGWVLGLAAGAYVVGTVADIAKQAKGTNKEKTEEKEKSKADEWDESVK